MKERPILFSAPMVLAILEGRKTQTRRVVFNRRTTDFQSIEERDDGSLWPWRETEDAQDYWYPCPYGQPGDRLWVRETFDPIYGQNTPDQVIKIDYKADNPPYRMMDELGTRRWTPSIHMPRWASRITLEVTDVRVERLQEISEADCIAEGAPGGHSAIPGYTYSATPAEHYRHIWESINGNGSWDDNPWVWVIEFKRIDKEGG